MKHNRRVHAILNYNGKNIDNKKEILPRTDQLTHQYTFWLKPDQSFEIFIDNKLQANGTIEDFYNALLLLARSTDPDAKKPEDWVDEARIVDPEDTKPEDWANGPDRIPDPDAKKPEDWDDDMDGDWEVPMISNPDYKGEWKPRHIPNPDYKGPWEAPVIPNPEYEKDEDLGAYLIGYIGLDLWTVRSGTIIDNILLTDDKEFASEFGNRTWADNVQAEIDLHEKYELEEKESHSAENDELKDEDEAEKLGS